ncbi:tRNA lysidine(34) synthetase TilS [Candidatus Peregrinibacteria bacterium CG_4_10_14_0_2_um_filter_38_24]|nr:MAG: tRNA lysidine(34) synthetase TilS [Candidatus Peregrinibacteria bacterium CG_4_10_14_0_2_um_filter_38_24]PJC38674.1 MAG: tRNA lysidine(34) synthetase TilS [Candidatus Peregrinibacteria bacterium CG_4_9_14_0_2_um_filter_38_9]
MQLQEAKKLEKSIFETLSKHIKKGEKVILGLSGGADSVFLFEMLKKFAEKTPIKIVAAHVNHMLRGLESEKDEKFVKDLAKKYKTEIKILKKDIAKISKKLGRGLEETGRQVRHEFFAKLAKELKTNLVLTAHHADDNLETILLNIVRGAGLKGLLGMEEKIKHKIANTDLSFLKPLLQVPKQQIENYLTHKKIEFVKDLSNLDETFNRNLIRSKIVPTLKKINKNIFGTVAKNVKNIGETLDFLDDEAKKFIKKSEKILKEKNALIAKDFREANKALKKAVIRELYKVNAKTLKDFGNAQIDEILKVLDKNIGNKSKKIGPITFSVNKNRIKVSVEKKHKKVQY